MRQTASLDQDAPCWELASAVTSMPCRACSSMTWSISLLLSLLICAQPSPLSSVMVICGTALKTSISRQLHVAKLRVAKLLHVLTA